MKAGASQATVSNLVQDGKEAGATGDKDVMGEEGVDSTRGVGVSNWRGRTKYLLEMQHIEWRRTIDPNTGRHVRSVKIKRRPTTFYGDTPRRVANNRFSTTCDRSKTQQMIWLAKVISRSSKNDRKRSIDPLRAVHYMLVHLTKI